MATRRVHASIVAAALTAALLFTDAWGSMPLTLQAGWESLHARDVSLDESSARLGLVYSDLECILALSQVRNAIDYTPASVDLISAPFARSEIRRSAQLTTRWATVKKLSGFAAVGGARGFADYRAIWLAEYYRQLFSEFPAYEAVRPHGWNASFGTRWERHPGSNIIQASALYQADTVAPGYEPQIFGPLLRGRSRLTTVGAKMSAENVLSPTIRSLLDVSWTHTTGRRPRASLQAAINWAATPRWVVRTTTGGVLEAPEFRAGFASLSLERDWANRWFAGIAVRAYRDSGEVLDPLIPSTAAPALRTWHAVASLRWQGEHAAFRLEAGPYHARYAPLPRASAHFSELYRHRDWRSARAAVDWRP